MQKAFPLCLAGSRGCVALRRLVIPGDFAIEGGMAHTCVATPNESGTIGRRLCGYARRCHAHHTS